MAFRSAPDVWAQLAAPLPAGVIKWRQDRRPTARDGKFYAPFVPYIDQQVVLDRLNAVAPDWDFAIDTIARAGEELYYAAGSLTIRTGETVEGGASFPSVAQRDGVGEGKSPKAAATDAFKRAAVLFGVGHELYAMKSVSVQMSDDSKFARPLQDPAVVWAKRQQAAAATGRPEVVEDREPAPEAPYVSAADAPDERFPSDGPPACPDCGGPMWDNRVGKRSPKSPDYKCKDAGCGKAIWLDKKPKAKAAPEPPPPVEDDDFDLPF